MRMLFAEFGGQHASKTGLETSTRDMSKLHMLKAVLKFFLEFRSRDGKSASERVRERLESFLGSECHLVVMTCSGQVLG